MLRSLLRFSIRDVMWLTAVVGLAFGWLVVMAGWAIDNSRALSAYGELAEKRTDLRLERDRIADQRNDLMEAYMYLNEKIDRYEQRVSDMTERIRVLQSKIARDD